LALVAVALWQRVDSLQTDAAKRLATAEQAATVAKANSATLATELRSAEARLAAAEARIADYGAQRAALDKLLADASSRESLRLSGDFEQLLSIAEQESQLALSPTPMLTALRVLDGRADLAPGPARDKLKAAIAKDTDALRAADLPDRAVLLGKSDELARLLDDLPLAAEVKPAPATRPAAKSTRNSNAPSSDTPDISTSTANINTGIQSDNLPSIGQLLSALTAPLTEWFKLRRIDGAQALLTSPEQQFWLRENMKLQAQSARLSLLARQPDSYQRSLEKVQQALAQYTDAKQPKVQLAQALITQLRAARLTATLPAARETRAVLLQLANMPVNPVIASQRELQKK
jgi:uncharacterized protein HemX